MDILSVAIDTGARNSGENAIPVQFSQSIFYTLWFGYCECDTTPISSRAPPTRMRQWVFSCLHFGILKRESATTEIGRAYLSSDLGLLVPKVDQIPNTDNINCNRKNKIEKSQVVYCLSTIVVRLGPSYTWFVWGHHTPCGKKANCNKCLIRRGDNNRIMDPDPAYWHVKTSIDRTTVLIESDIQQRAGSMILVPLNNEQRPDLEIRIGWHLLFPTT